MARFDRQSPAFTTVTGKRDWDILLLSLFFIFVLWTGKRLAVYYRVWEEESPEIQSEEEEFHIIHEEVFAEE